MDCGGTTNETRTNAEQNETGGDFRVSFESLIDEGGKDDLYFIRIANGPVKIGRSNNVKKRLRMLQCASPYDLEIVGILRGGGDLEACFHANLDEFRLRGEWFEWSNLAERAIRAAINGGRWRTVFGIDEWQDNDWRIGSPLYEPPSPRTPSATDPEDPRKP